MAVVPLGRGVLLIGRTGCLQGGSSEFGMKCPSSDPVAKGTSVKTQGFGCWEAKTALGEFGCRVGNRFLGVTCSGCRVPNALSEAVDSGNAMVAVTSS